MLLMQPPLHWHHIRLDAAFHSARTAQRSHASPQSHQLQFHVPGSMMSFPLPSCSYAQLGAGYSVSNAATATVARAHADTKTFMNAHGVGDVVLGPSTSQLLDNLGGCYSRVLGPGDEASPFVP